VPLPVDNPKLKWPPRSAMFDEMTEHAAWFAGDTEALAKVYGAHSHSPIDRTDSNRPNPFKRLVNRFWGRRGKVTDNGSPAHMHIPLAGDIAKTSADLLVGEPPTFEVPFDNEEGKAEATKAQDRLEELIEETGTQAQIAEAFEWGSALGGVFFRPVIDREVSPTRPIFTIVPGNQAVPEFSFGILRAVTFWQELERHEDTNRVIRHLERYEPGGVILHGLYEGGTDTLGKKIPLTEHSATASLAKDPALDGDAITFED
jgi:hypothetical protein